MGKKRRPEGRRRVGWSDLDDDLTDYILKKLPISDLLRCRDVCRPWRSIANTHISSSPMNSPVLVLPNHYIPELCSERDGYFFENSSRDLQQDGRIFCFFNPVTNKLYELSHKSRNLLKGTYFVGSSDGWALFTRNSGLVVLNAAIDVGILITCPPGDSVGIKKAFLLGDTFFDRIVVLRGGMHSDIRFTLSGDKQFRHLVAYQWYQSDMVHFNRLVYVVIKKGFIQAWDFNQMGCTPPTMVENYQPSFNPGKELSPYAKLSLMDSLGELWLVSKSSWGMHSKFRVYKMNFKERKWVDMDSLGDRVVLLFTNQSISFSLPLETSKYKKNCVYFEDSVNGSASCRIYVYNLEDGSVEKSRL